MDRFPPMYRLATGFYRYIWFPLHGGAKAKGVDLVPRDGGMILAPVHASKFDPCALAATCKHRRLRAMAKKELWKNPIYGAVIEAIGAFPVDRGSADMESVKKCISILQGGEAVIVFPEGTRNDGETMNPLQSGVAMLAKKAGVPVVPAGIGGTAKGAKGKITVVYGEPFRYEDVAKGANERENRKLFLDELAGRIQSLCREAGLDLKSAPDTSDRPERLARDTQASVPTSGSA